MLANPWIGVEVSGGFIHLFRRGESPAPFLIMSAADAEALAKSLHKAALSAVPHPNDLLTLEELRNELPKMLEVRVLNALHWADVYSLGELRQHGRRRLWRLNNIGTKAIVALEALLASKGLELEP